jgi:uroporphyrinogen decarboxylase
MTSRERVATLLNKRIPDRMGIYDHFWSEVFYDDGWPAHGYPKGKDPVEFFDFDLVNCGGWFDTSPVLGRNDVLEETAEWRITRDGRGAVMKQWKDRSGVPEHIGFEITTPAIWRQYRDRLLAADRSRLGDIPGIKKNLETARARGKFGVYGNVFVFEILRGTMGDVNFLPALIEEPEWIHDFCRVYLDHFRTHFEILFKEAGVPDGMWIYEDWGFRNGLFCSPATMKEMIMPYEKALVSFFKDYGLPVILHSCGDIRKAIPLIVDAGFDCLQPMEAKAGCNVLDIARTYGDKLAYMGNIDVVQLSTNDPAKVRDEIVPKLTELRNMRIPYFFHSDHSIPPSIRYETYQLALDLFREYGRY